MKAFVIQLRFFPFKETLETSSDLYVRYTNVVICSDIHNSVYDKLDDFGFPMVHFPSLSGDVPRPLTFRSLGYVR